MRGPEKAGMVSTCLVITVLLGGVLAGWHRYLEWQVSIPSLAGAISIPFVYDWIQQRRRLARLRGFWRSQLYLVENPNNRRSAKEILGNMVSVEGYVRTTYDEFQYVEYVQKMQHVDEMIRSGVKEDAVLDELGRALGEILRVY